MAKGRRRNSKNAFFNGKEGRDDFRKYNNTISMNKEDRKALTGIEQVSNRRAKVPLACIE